LLLYFCVQDIGGCDIQKQEIREAVELPLTHHELYKQIGIDPPRGVLLYGPPGTGKTMLAKAVAHHTTAAFIRVVGSEFVQKYLGEVSWGVCTKNWCPCNLLPNYTQHSLPFVVVKHSTCIYVCLCSSAECFVVKAIYVFKYCLNI
jgi:hypothetical protein